MRKELGGLKLSTRAFRIIKSSEKAGFASVKNILSPSGNTLAYHIKEKRYTAPIRFARLVKDILKILSEFTDKQMQVFAEEGLINPWNFLLSEGELIFTPDVRLPFYSGHSLRFSASQNVLDAPQAWYLPLGIMLRSAITGDFKHLLGVSPTQRLSLWLDKSKLLQEGACLPEDLLDMLSELFSRPGTFGIRRETLSGMFARMQKIYKRLESVTLNKDSKSRPPVSLLKFFAPKVNAEKEMIFALCSFDRPRRPDKVSKAEEKSCFIAVRRTLKLLAEYNNYYGRLDVVMV